MLSRQNYPIYLWGDVPKLRGSFPTFLGDSPTLLGDSPTLLGDSPTALGDSPTALGDFPTALGDPPAALGDSPTALGDPPADLGDPPADLGDPPTALGDPPAAWGDPPVAWGDSPKASGQVAEPLRNASRHLLKDLKPGIYLFLPLILLTSCSCGEEGNFMTCRVTRGDFENILTVDGYVEPLRSTSASCPPYIQGSIGFLAEDGALVKEGEVVCIVEVPELQTDYDQLKADYETARINFTKSQADLALQYALLEAEVKTNEAETQIALLDSLQLKYAPPNQVKIKELELQQVTIQKNRFEKKLAALHVIRQTELKMQELKVQQLANRLQDAKEKLDALTIKAPKDGLAVRAISWMTGKKLQVGDQAWHTMPLINLPELGGMKIIIRAPESDYKYINVDDSLIFTFDAMPGNLGYGKIRTKSPVGQQYREKSKVKFFDIEASIDSVPLMPDPGYTAACRILLKQLKDTLIVPQIAVFDEDSIKVVYVKQGRTFDMQQVQIGISSLKEAVVTAGLQGDEEISLMKPAASFIRRRLLLPVEEPADSIRNETVHTHSNEII